MATVKPRDIKLSRLIKEELINLELAGTDKKKIISELVELIARTKKIKDKKGFLKAVLERERLGSTGIGNGVAIPHAKSKAVRDFVLVFARKDDGIDFGALDGEKTHVFFSLASPESDVGSHLKALAGISRLVKDKFTVELLKRANSKKEVLRIISNAEKSLS